MSLRAMPNTAALNGMSGRQTLMPGENFARYRQNSLFHLCFGPGHDVLGLR
tara:strand:- start:1 stop:153 length:153 start_codon:yes stop_codon:yes gene_type:complete